MSDTPITIGMVGLGGFAGSVLSSIRRLENAANPLVKLTAACEPMQDLHAARIAELRGQGVTVVPELSDLLKLPVQALWMPVPIPLHRPFACQAMEAGKWVICEKPAAGAIQDVDAMIATRDRVGGKIAIGYQDIYELSTPQIKQELMDGTIGRINRVTVTCCWPRGSDYFSRNNWAGHVRCGQTWVLDSPCMNAMAHFVNFPLFLLGRSMESAATICRVSAELYRARAIESADTCAIRLQTAEGPTVLILMTHSCGENSGPSIVFEGDLGRCCMNVSEARFELATGTGKTIRRHVDHARPAEAAIGRWTGRRQGELISTLELARTQVLAINAAFDAVAVKDLPASAYTVKQDGARTQPVIHGIEETFRTCGQKGLLPSEVGTSWASRGGSLDLAGYTEFRGTHYPRA